MISLLTTMKFHGIIETGKQTERNERENKMWELKVKITLTTETEEISTETAAILSVRIDNTIEVDGRDYLYDDEVTAEAVEKAVEKWQRETGLVNSETIEVDYHYEPEKAKKVK